MSSFMQNTLSESDKEKRRHIIDEILETEQNYVRDLQLVKNKFIQVIEERSILNKEEIAILFSNIETLRNTNETILQQLEATPGRIGQVFLDNANLLKVYAVYCSNQPRINSIMKQFSSRYPAFHDLVEKNFTSETRYLGLEDFLIMPMQRITKYPLLLKSLSQVTHPEDDEKQKLEESIGKITNIVCIINERTRRAELVQKLANVQNRLVNGNQLDIVSENRTLIHEGKLKMKRQVFSNVSLDDSYAYLFNDKLFICERESGNDTNSLYTLRTTFFLSDICNIASTDTYGTKKECSINISLILFEGGKYQEKKYKMRAPTREERDLWVKKLKEAMDAFMNISSTNNQPQHTPKRVHSAAVDDISPLKKYNSNPHLPMNLTPLEPTTSPNGTPRPLAQTSNDKKMFRRSVSLKEIGEVKFETMDNIRTSSPPPNPLTDSRALRKRNAMFLDVKGFRNSVESLENTREDVEKEVNVAELSKEELYLQAVLGMFQVVDQIKPSLSIHQTEKLDQLMKQNPYIEKVFSDMKDQLKTHESE